LFVQLQPRMFQTLKQESFPNTSMILTQVFQGDDPAD